MEVNQMKKLIISVIGMSTLLFMQGAFYKDAEKNESSRNKIK